MKKNFFNNRKDSLFDRLDFFIKSIINPKLTLHGGNVSLIEITKDRYAVLKLNGKCKNCFMSHLTLSNLIEKEILNIFFDELKGVKELKN